MRIVLLLLLLASQAWAQPDFRELEKVATAELQETNTPGAVVVVVKDDRVIYTGAFGVASVETREAVRPEMLFRLGSTTKMFVATALALLADGGKVQFDQPIRRYIADLPTAVGRLTLHQLLSHTSGLRDTAVMFGPHDDAALGAGILAWNESWFFTEPGAIYSYSNPGYWLSGYALERITGKPFADAMHETVFQRLGMQRTTFRPTLAMTYPLALGHDAPGKETPKVVRPFADNASNWPAGSMFSSGPELARFVLAFLNRQGLPAAVVETLSTPRVDTNAEGEYGYGLGMRRSRGVNWISHNGSRSGYGSMIQMAPAHRFGVIVLVNKSGGTLPKTLEKADELLLTLEAKPAPEPPAPPSASPRYAGVYVNGDSRTELVIRDGKLAPKEGARGPLRIVEKGGQIYMVRGGRAARKIP